MAGKDERPPVAVVFWAFRLMAGIGGLMIATGLIAIVLYLKKRLFDTRWFQYLCMALTPAGVCCCTGRLVCHRSGPSTMDRPGTDAHIRCHLPGNGEHPSPFP